MNQLLIKIKLDYLLKSSKLINSTTYPLIIIASSNKLNNVLDSIQNIFTFQININTLNISQRELYIQSYLKLIDPDNLYQKIAKETAGLSINQLQDIIADITTAMFIRLDYIKELKVLKILLK